MKKIILIVLALLLLIAAGAYWYVKKNGVSADVQGTSATTENKGLLITKKIVAMDSKENVVLLDSTADLAFDKTYKCLAGASLDRKNIKTDWKNSKIPLDNVVYKNQVGKLVLSNGRYGVISPNYSDKCYSSYIEVYLGTFFSTGTVSAKDTCAYDYNGDQTLSSLDLAVLANMWRDKTVITTEYLAQLTSSSDLKAFLQQMLTAKKTSIELDDVLSFKEKLVACSAYQK